MSTKDWKDKELNGLLNERWGFSMDLSKLNESNCGSASRDDKEALEEADMCPKCEKSPCCCERMEEKKGKYDDGDNKDEKCDYVDCGDKEEVNEIRGPLDALKGGDSISPEESKKEMEKARKNLKHVGNKVKIKKEEKLREAIRKIIKKQLGK